MLWRPPLGAGGVTMDGVGSFSLWLCLVLCFGTDGVVQLTVIARAFPKCSPIGLYRCQLMRVAFGIAFGETKHSSMCARLCW